MSILEKVCLFDEESTTPRTGVHYLGRVTEADKKLPPPLPPVV